MSNVSNSHTIGSDDALELIRDLTGNPDIILPFKEEPFKRCTQRISDLYDLNLKALLELRSHEHHQPDEEERVMTMVRARQFAIDRVKRCCCTYVKTRMERLRHLRWKAGGQLPEAVKANLSRSELRWQSEYSNAIFKYQDRFGENGVNLLDHVKPPQSLHIFVRAVKDFGKFETSDGVTVCLTKDSMHFLPPRDCENLIRRGVLEHVTG